MAVAKTADGLGAVVRYTWKADVNADETVDADDFFLIDRGFLRRSTLFHEGNLDFSWVVDLDDYLLIDEVWLARNDG